MCKLASSSTPRVTDPVEKKNIFRSTSRDNAIKLSGVDNVCSVALS